MADGRNGDVMVGYVFALTIAPLVIPVGYVLFGYLFFLIYRSERKNPTVFWFLAERPGEAKRREGSGRDVE